MLWYRYTMNKIKQTKSKDLVCSFAFSKKIYHSVSYITHRRVYITALLCKAISLRIGHIPMTNTLIGWSFWFMGITYQIGF